MVASNHPAVEDATNPRPNQEPRLSDVEEKTRAADETSTRPPAYSATPKRKPLPEKVVEAGITADEKKPTTPEGTSSKHHDIRPSTPGAEKKDVGASPRSSIQTDFEDVNPPDFQGEVLTNDELPSPETVRKIENYIVLDRHGKTHTFKSLYTGRNVARRVLIIFVRHFFCGVSVIYIFQTGPHPPTLAPPPAPSPGSTVPLTSAPRTARNTSAPSRPPSRPRPSSSCPSRPSSRSWGAATRA